MNSFIAIDYETANSSYESVCAVGISLVENNEIKSSFYSLIKPPSEFSFFDPFNSSIHGITQSQVKNSPSFKDVWKDIDSLYSKNRIPFACHYAGFDIRVTEALLSFIEVEFEDIHFYDTCTISKKIWPELLNFKLNTISDFLEIDLDHHNAASDAEACAKIAIKHLENKSLPTLREVAKSYGYDLGVLNSTGVRRMSDSKHYGNSKSRDFGNYIQTSKGLTPNTEVHVESELYEKKIVFTGELESMNRSEAIQKAVNNGATVASSVSKKTDYLIVGKSDFLDFTNGVKTRKFKDAEAAKKAGSSIEIIDEEDFLRLLIG